MYRCIGLAKLTAVILGITSLGFSEMQVLANEVTSNISDQKGDVAASSIEAARKGDAASSIRGARKGDAASSMTGVKNDAHTDIKFRDTGPLVLTESLLIPAKWLDDSPERYGVGYDEKFIDSKQRLLCIYLGSCGHPAGLDGRFLAALCKSKPKTIFSNDWTKEPGWSLKDVRYPRASRIVKSLVGVTLPQGCWGANQFTSPKDTRFFINSMKLRLIGGKTVLVTEGYLTERAFGKNYSGPKIWQILISVPEEDGTVHSMTYSAKGNESNFLDKRWIFDKSIASIKWKKDWN